MFLTRYLDLLLSFQARRRRGGSGAILKELSDPHNLVLSDMQISKIYVGVSGIAAKMLLFALEVGQFISEILLKNVKYLTSMHQSDTIIFLCSLVVERPTCVQIGGKVVFGSVGSAILSIFSYSKSPFSAYAGFVPHPVDWRRVGANFHPKNARFI